MDSQITKPYQIADHHCRITWVYNTCVIIINNITSDIHHIPDLKKVL